MKYLIIANGVLIDNDRLSVLIRQSDVVVCADGGANHLKRINIAPDVVIGDMDSIGNESLLYFTQHLSIRGIVQKQGTIIRYPEKKDISDTELAVLWAIEHGATDITLTGVTGARMDHTMSNIFLLHTITKKGLQCKIVDDHNEIYLLSHDSAMFNNPSPSTNDPPMFNNPSKSNDSPIFNDPSKSNDSPIFNNSLSSRMSINGKTGDLLSIIAITEKVTGLTLKGFEYPLENATLTLGSSRGISNVFTQETVHISLKYGILLVIKPWGP